MSGPKLFLLISHPMSWVARERGGVGNGGWEQHLFCTHTRDMAMITRASTKVTTSPMMTLVSTFDWSESWLCWEPWRGRSVKRSCMG